MNQSLPANFLWGNSVSSMQTEGAWNERAGRGCRCTTFAKQENISDWKVATDSYHRCRKISTLMQDLGMSCYRQISTEPGLSAGRRRVAFNDEASPFYDTVASHRPRYPGR